MHAGVGRGRADEGHARLKQGNVRQEAWRQRGRIVRKEVQRREIDYERQKRDSEKETKCQGVKKCQGQKWRRIGFREGCSV